MELKEQLFELLGRANQVYQSELCWEQLDLLAEIFAEALQGESPESITRAFALHIKSCKRFPTPAHIRELLPECAASARIKEEPGQITPGFGAAIARDIQARIKGGARAESSSQVCSRVLAALQRGETLQ